MPQVSGGLLTAAVRLRIGSCLSLTFLIAPASQWSAKTESCGTRLELQHSLMMFFTGSAEDIERRKVANFGDRTYELRAMYEMVKEGERILFDSSRPLAQLGTSFTRPG